MILRKMKLQTLVFAIFTWVFFPIPGQAQAPAANSVAASGQAPASNLTPAADSSAPKDYLSSKWKQANFSLTQTGLDNWRQQQKKTWEEKIAALPDSVKARLTDRADKALSYTWPALPASLYLEYKMNGNRSHFEQRQNERRAALSSLVIGELVTRDKKYLPQIVNGIWATLEESTWVLPAHIGMQRGGTGLPDPQEAIIDLFDGETAASLSAMRFMLEEELQQYSPVIGQRIGYELDKRVFLPYLQRTDFWWMGFGDRRPNNWNPWINSNVLSAVLLSGQHIDTIGRLLQKILSSTDKFIDGYGDDGGCDEGPSYWSEAGGKLIRILLMNHRKVK